MYLHTGFKRIAEVGAAGHIRADVVALASRCRSPPRTKDQKYRSRSLPETTLPSPGCDPPTVVIGCFSYLHTFFRVLPRSALPVTSVPIKLPCTTFPLALAGSLKPTMKIPPIIVARDDVALPGLRSSDGIIGRILLQTCHRPHCPGRRSRSHRCRCRLPSHHVAARPEVPAISNASTLEAIDHQPLDRAIRSRNNQATCITRITPVQLDHEYRVFAKARRIRIWASPHLCITVNADGIRDLR